MTLFYTGLLCIAPNLLAAMLVAMIERPLTSFGRDVLVFFCTLLHFLGFWFATFILLAIVAVNGNLVWLNYNTVLALAFIAATPLSMYAAAALDRGRYPDEDSAFNAHFSGAICGVALMLALTVWASNQPEFGEEAALQSIIESSIA